MNTEKRAEVATEIARVISTTDDLIVAVRNDPHVPIIMRSLTMEIQRLGLIVRALLDEIPVE